jgi:serine protease Do
MKIASDILSFFANRRPGELVTVNDFVNSNNLEDYEGKVIFRTLAILKNQGYLISLGNDPTIQNPVLAERLWSIDFNEHYGKYGTYDFIVEGFGAIASHFTKSVRPIVIQDRSGKIDIGTSFLFNKSHLLTAKHVVEHAETVKLLRPDGSPADIHSIMLSNEPNVDIAVITIEDGSFEELPPFNITEKHTILEEVMTIGYPPIPGFDAIPIYERGSINNNFKFSRGEIVGNGESYLDGQNYFLMNAKVKGGNSGGPVINSEGFVIGMIGRIPADSADKHKLDSLGYGIVTPSIEFEKFFSDEYRKEHIFLYYGTNKQDGFAPDWKFSDPFPGAFLHN